MANKIEKDKYIVIVPNPTARGLYDWKIALRKVEFPIDKPEEKVLEDIEKYIRGNSHRHYRIFRGREVYL